MKSTETFQKIVETTFGLVAEHGIKKTSFSMIAKEVGISKPAIYYYFPSKEALIDYIFEEIFSGYHFNAYFPLMNYNKRNFQDSVIKDGYQMIAEYEENPFILRVVNEFIIETTRNEKYQQRIYSMQDDFLKGFADLLTRGVEMGIVSQDKKETKAHSLALLLDSISNYILMGFRLDYKSMWELAVKSVFDKNQEDDLNGSI